MDTKQSKKVNEHIQWIKSILDTQVFQNKNNSPGLLNDLGGTVLFYYYYSRIFDDDETYEKANHTLQRILTSLPFLISENMLTYCSGVSGIAWLISHLDEENFIDIEDDFFNELDGILETYMLNELRKGNYDFLHGGMGTFNYFLQKKVETPVLKKAIDILIDTKLDFNNGYYWPELNLLEDRYDIGSGNLGLAHGSPSILILVAKYFQFTGDTRCKDLLEKGIDFIYNAKNPPQSISVYPYSFKTFEQEPNNSRLGWCYGDLGIALVSMLIGKLPEFSHYHKNSINILNHTIERDLQGAFVRDAAICHGACGISLMYSSFFEEIQDRRLLSESNKWLNLAFHYLDMEIETITKGTKFDTKLGYVTSYGLLEGISGVGLSLLSNICQQKLNWQKALLLP